MQGHILSSFFYGYLMTQIVGGWIAKRIGGKTVFAVNIGVTSVLTLLTPLLTKTSVYLLIAVRIVEGIFEVSNFLIIDVKTSWKLFRVWHFRVCTQLQPVGHHRLNGVDLSRQPFRVLISEQSYRCPFVLN